jgi:hypothetical protein
MDPKGLAKLSDLVGQDLAGWIITECYFLELKHGLMGSFPAVSDDKEVIATLNKSALGKVWDQLEKRPAKVSSLRVIAHPEKGVAFCLDNYMKGDTEPLRTLSTEEITALCEKKDAIQWAPGLTALAEQSVPDPVFA